MPAFPVLAWEPLADSALLVRVGDGAEIEERVVEAIWALTAAIDAHLPPGVVDVVPAYSTILLGFDPVVTTAAHVADAVGALAVTLELGEEFGGREVVIPVCYGGEHGPDLAEVAALTGLTAAEVIAAHAGGHYRVACMGYAPGWAYLMGLPPSLAVPRRASPRVRVPAGSVAIGGAQTGVYPLETPGGWSLIGRTPLAVFAAGRSDPFLLHPADRVRFEPIDHAEYTRLLERES